MKLLNISWRKLKYPFIFQKRERFTIQTVILTSGLLISQLVWEDYRFFLVAFLATLTYILTIWSLHEDIKGIEWLLLFILPVVFTVSFSLFYFLLPARWISRSVVTVIFAIGMYAVLLIENIYNVAAQRSIQLLRAAYSIGLLVSVVLVFLMTSIIFSMHLTYFHNFIFIFIVVFILSLQSLWSIKLEPFISKQILLFSFGVALGVGEIALTLSFWPVAIAMVSLCLSASYYTMIGIFQLHFLERLFRNSLREYLLVFLFTILIIILGSHWG